MRSIPLLTSLVVLAFSLPAAAGGPIVPNLTGTWVGEFKCTEYDFTGKFKFPEEATLEISQSGNELIIDWVFEGGYAGLVVPDAKKPAERGIVSLIECDTDTDQLSGFAEMAILKAKIDREKGKGKMKGEGTYNLNGSFIGECKWKFSLESLADPGATGCNPL